MRSGFGRLALELRLSRNINQKQFASEVGMSLSRISNIEHQRCAVTDDVVDAYAFALRCSEADRNELKKRAKFSNNVRTNPDLSEESRPVAALLRQFGDQLSPKARDQIRQIVERETGEQLAELRFSSNQVANISKKKVARGKLLSPHRLVDIALEAETLRAELNMSSGRLDIGRCLDLLASHKRNFDYEIREALPSHLLGAFAHIVGDSQGHTLVLERQRFEQTLKNVTFMVHVICHEIGHHILHAHLLQGEGVFEPQELARNDCKQIGSERQIKQVINTKEEAEAECFATFFLVPWTAYYKGTEVWHLAKDYNEQLDEVKRYAGWVQQPAVKDEFRRRLWQAGIKKHFIFNID